MIEERKRFGVSWLIERDEGVKKVLVLGTDGEEKTLPVFSYEEEAWLFLDLSGLGPGWRVGRIWTIDLLSVLAEARLDVRHVALDPIPEIGLHGPHDLVSMSREEFVEVLETAPKGDLSPVSGF